MLLKFVGEILGKFLKRFGNVLGGIWGEISGTVLGFTKRSGKWFLKCTLREWYFEFRSGAPSLFYF